MTKKRLLSLTLAVGLALQLGAGLPAAGAAAAPAPVVFSDVEHHWAKDWVGTIAARGLMHGTAPETFSPDTPITRATMVTVLYRLEGEPAVKTDAGYADTPENAWYEKALAWATAEGLVEGYGNEEFRPHSCVTREQLAAMFYRYVGGHVKAVLPFPYEDREDISAWSADAVYWAGQKKLLEGYPDGTLRPGGCVTRGEAAAFLCRFLAILEETYP
ncbi:MAG: S-layer homology domain-containing protein, partial [Oscillospiraceae bacterium]